MASLSTDLLERLVPVYTDFFYKREGDERFLLINGSVCCWLLNTLYLRFIRNNETEPLENLPIDKKEMYWRLAKLYHSTELERIKAARSAYVLELITSTY